MGVHDGSGPGGQGEVGSERQNSAGFEGLGARRLEIRGEALIELFLWLFIFLLSDIGWTEGPRHLVARCSGQDRCRFHWGEGRHDVTLIPGVARRRVSRRPGRASRNVRSAARAGLERTRVLTILTVKPPVSYE